MHYERYAAECISRFGLLPDCAQLLETALEFNPRRATSHLALGNFYLRSGDAARALGPLSTALSLDPSLHEALRGLGDIYCAQGKLGLAEERYQQYLKARPQDPLAYFNLASLAAQKGDTRLALVRLEEALGHGFSDPALIRQDTRWKRLLEDPSIKAFLGKLETQNVERPR
jgi:tetratricopeptide (TPR) repeat protein